jgi:hypothetical protein
MEEADPPAGGGFARGGVEDVGAYFLHTLKFSRMSAVEQGGVR